MSKAKDSKIRFSVLDVVIIIVVLALVATLILRFTADSRLFNYETQKYTVTLKSCGIRYTSIDMIPSTSDVYLDDGELLGKFLHAPTVTPMLSYTVSPSGELIAAYYPDNTLVDIIAELECDLIVKDGMVMTKSGVHIAHGNVLEVHTATVDLTVEIVGVEKQISE